ncbi:MAG: hypothetical protein KAJ40_08010 [Alphaproteobacteria bacterium]|nr:hypothetical protein [Alphaproteobacteria bacterium]
MPYEVCLKPKNGDMSLKEFQEFFSKRKNCRVDGSEGVYENQNTGVGFCFEYMHEENKGALNVRPDGIYRVVLSVEYCQPAFFFVEALYEIYDLVKQENFVVYDPQADGKSGGWPFSDKEMFDNWTHCNEGAVLEYIIGLREEMQYLPVMPYDTVQKVWEWNYFLEKLGETLDAKMHIPTILAVEYKDEYLTAVVWREGCPIAIPYVDIVIFSRRKKGADPSSFEEDDFEYCVVDYEEIKPLIDKYSEKEFANAFILGYDTPPEEITSFIAGLNSRGNFSLIDMCDILECEVIEDAVLPIIQQGK